MEAIIPESTRKKLEDKLKEAKRIQSKYEHYELSLVTKAIEEAGKRGIKINYILPDSRILDMPNQINVFVDSEDNVVDHQELISLVKTKYPSLFIIYTAYKRKSEALDEELVRALQEYDSTV